MKSRMRRRLVSDMNVVPYIDVMLVLLVIFMVTAPMLQQGVAVDLPKAAAKTLPPQKRDPIIVSVDAQGAYYLNILDAPEIPLEGRQMAIRVASELKKDPTVKVFVKGDKNAQYGSIMQAMVLLQYAGVENVGLVTEQPTAPKKGS